ncbi:MAG TPA: glycosyltransferase family 39 protein [Pirellulales bacterium]|nr:glycosyltransferase family 39 protein [Pirellulales bacterium]
MTLSAWEPAAPPCDGAQPSVNARSASLVSAPAGRLLAGLVLLCLVPRAVMAWKLDAVCRDGVFYIQLAQAFEQGDVATGLNKLRLNAYPPLLALLHHVGLDWEWAGKFWGVCVSSLAVLPLFGWTRRQFDDRLATVACLLYAVHPKLIEWSPELVRDPTFWFFWTLSLYCCWRAAAETRWRWYLAGGVAIALASHTRFEGWCLYLPLVWWSACRWPARRELRRAVVANVALSLAVCPLLIALVNVTWLARESHWEWGNFSRLEYVALWFRAAVGNDEEAPAAVAVVSSAPAPAGDRSPHAPRGATHHAERDDDNAVVTPPPRLSNARLLWIFTNTLRRGVGALFGLLWLVGFTTAPRTWLRRDQVVLFLIAAMIAVGIWIHLWYAQATSSRYFLALVLIGCPCAATGWLRLCDVWATWRKRSVAEFVRIPNVAVPIGTRASSATRNGRRWRSAFIGVFVLLAVGGVGEALADRHDSRRRDAALGRWVLSEFGPGQRMVTSSDWDVLAYYARGSAGPWPAADEAGRRWPAAWRPDLAFVSRRGASPAQLREFVAEATARGYRPLEPARLPADFDWTDLLVLKR